MDKKLVLVFGNGRTGTSLVVGILNRLGVDIGGEYTSPTYAPSIKYVYGYGEAKHDEDLKWLVEYNFKATEGLLEYPDPIFEKRLKDISKKRGKIWGWKTINTPHLIPWIVRVFDPYCVITYRRNKEAHAQSIRNGLSNLEEKAKPLSHFYKRIDNHNKLIDEVVRKYDLKHIKVYFEDFFNNPDKPIKQMCDFLGLEYNPAVKYFINKDFKHYG